MTARIDPNSVRPRSTFVALALLAGSALAAPPPIEHYVKPPAIDSVAISPSGQRLAILAFNPQGRRILTVMGLEPIGEPRMVGGFVDADVTMVSWVNDDRLVYEASMPGAKIPEGGGGMFAVNHDGGERRQLIAWRGGITATSIGLWSNILPHYWALHSTIDDSSADVVVVQRRDASNAELKQAQLARLNTRTAELNPFGGSFPAGLNQFWLDSRSEPRIVSTYVRGRIQLHWRAPGLTTWERVADFDPLDEGAFVPWLIDSNGEVLVTGRLGGDFSAVHRFDPVAKRVDPAPLVGVAGYDLRPAPETDPKTGRLVGVHFVAHKRMSYWFDESIDRIQQGIDAVLPKGRTNRLLCGRCESTRFFVVHSSSDRQPGEYLLFDRTTASIQTLGVSRPWIDEAQQGTRTVHRVPARDGLPLPVYVTHPANSALDQPLPAIVRVHGGPWVRGTDLGWRAEAQFLASRGYRVLEPEFRGSEGYGFRHFRAGWKQWGTAMQHDLVDVVEWAAKQKLIDADRVCVMGSSYGGYAALMAPIVAPGVFRCAASFAAPTDLKLSYDIPWSDTSADARKYSMPILIGDPVKDADLLVAASPLKRAGEIKIPILLGHGAIDRRVPVDHARRFVHAARSADVAIETVIYKDEGHGLYEQANRADYMGRLERFFDKALKSLP